MSQAIDEAIEGLYAVFERYPLRESTGPCPCCHNLELAEAKLHAQPLRELGAEHLCDYASDAFHTWGDVEEFKHFLPRILELFITAQDCFVRHTDAEILMAKFRYGNWRNWPFEEQAAVEKYLHSVWRGVLDNPPIDGGFRNVERWLCAIGQCEDDLSPYLREWIEDEKLSATRALSSLLLTSAVARTGTKGRNLFWKDRNAQYAQLQQWVKSATVIEKLNRAETGCEGTELAEEFAAARAMCR
jgi:hypothetical protein